MLAGGMRPILAKCQLRANRIFDRATRCRRKWLVGAVRLKSSLKSHGIYAVDNLLKILHDVLMTLS